MTSDSDVNSVRTDFASHVEANSARTPNVASKSSGASAAGSDQGTVLHAAEFEVFGQNITG